MPVSIPDQVGPFSPDGWDCTMLGERSPPPAMWPPPCSLALGMGTDTSYMTSRVREVFWHSRQRTIDTTRPWNSSETIEAKWVAGSPSSSFLSPLPAPGSAAEDEDAPVPLVAVCPALPRPARPSPAAGSPSGGSPGARYGAAERGGWAEPMPATMLGWAAPAPAFHGNRISSTSVTPSVLWQSCMSCRVAEGAAEAAPPGRRCPPGSWPISSSALGRCSPSTPAGQAPAPALAEDATAADSPGASRPKHRRRWPWRSSGTSRRSSSWRLSRTQRRNSCESCCA
mmetsp:Transcript_89212/g.266080  ORF Transcript_89212/g.266080 Transcript_89212/m.266080 type:complete len:284 (-) Transcript_89212:531-1382(-)